MKKKAMPSGCGCFLKWWLTTQVWLVAYVKLPLTLMRVTNFNNLNSERMTPEEFLYKQGYTQKVRYPDGKEVEPTFQRITVVRLLEQYAQNQANGQNTGERQLTIPDVIRRHFDNDETCQNFINALGEMLGRVSFDGNRTIKQAKGTTASMVLRFNKFKSLPDGEGYYLGINKMGTITLD